jgi:integrase
MQRSYSLFENSVGSETTLYQYKLGLEHFLKFVRYEHKYDDYLKLEPEIIQKHLEDYVIFHNRRNIKRITIKGYLKPVYLFLDVNKIHYFPKVLNKMMRKDKTKKGNDKPFSDEDIQFMLEYTNSSRNKALVLFFTSLGGRPAIITDPILRFKHLFSMPYGCKAVFIYSGSDEEYWGFLTPESSKAFDVYRDERIRKGENITPESPLFIIEKKHNRENDNHLTLDSLYSLMVNLQKKAPIEKIKVGNRNDKALFYGFRKRFNTILKINSDVNSNIAEKLLAHQNGLDGVYLKPTREECFEEFLKAIPKLTVSKAEKLSLKLEKSESEKDEKIMKLQIEMKEIYKLLERINVHSS